MKRALFLLMLWGSLGTSAFAQPWSKIATTSHFSLIEKSSFFGPDRGGLKLNPDAVAVNQYNSNAVHPQGTVYMAYSSTDEPINLVDPVDKGTWLLGFDPNGNEVLSKKIDFISPYNYGGGIYENIITITSLQYNQHDLLVFTGTMYGGNGNWKSIMLIGTYNLTTGDTEIKIKQFTGFYNSQDKIQTNESKGVGLQPLDEQDQRYLAVGQIMQSEEGLDSPIAVAFEVDHQGNMTVLRTETFDIRYLPKAVNSIFTGTSVFTAGIYKYPEPNVRLQCNNNNSIVHGVAICEFTYDVGSNDIALKKGQAVYSGKLQLYPDFYKDDGPMSLVYDAWGEKEGIVTFTHNLFFPRTSSSLLSYFIHFSGFGNAANLYTVSTNNFNVNMMCYKAMDQEGFFKLMFQLERQSGTSVIPNNTSIGILKIDPNNIGASPLTVDQLWSHGFNSFAGHSEGQIKGVSGAYYYNGRQEYFMADGYNKPASASRVSIFSSYGDEYVQLCHNSISANIESVSCLLEEYVAGSPGVVESTFTDLIINPYFVLEVNDITATYIGCGVNPRPGQEEHSERKASASDQIEQAQIVETKVLHQYGNTYRIQFEEAAQRIQMLDLSGREIPVNLRGNIIETPVLAPAVYLFKVSFKNQPDHVQKIIVQ